tara:strand:- start:251 stop:676 length:426 start_codon:yes stop_codon:yes gene_type:complete
VILQSRYAETQELYVLLTFWLGSTNSLQIINYPQKKTNGGIMSKNKFGKSVDVANAYATYRYEHPIDKHMYFEWKILKTYQKKENEDKNQYARWFTACKSPMTYDDWEYGDGYINDIVGLRGTKLISATDDWKATYENQSG